ncbi:hypothetical protein TWF694_003016 [Orbilia ellipsospora]|uniref:Rhodopsin domain-containing protein n=1 Tax=Orbilia ellipsospora TaxID=2528407 RepID=A0AAV9X1H9_9PEZI
MRRYQAQGESRSWLRIGDWFVIVGLVSFYGTAFVNIISAVWDLPAQNPTTLAEKAALERRWIIELKIAYVSNYFWSTTMWCVKFYLVTLFYQLIPTTTMPIQRMVLHILAVYTVISFLLLSFFYIFYCLPISRNWDLDPQRMCTTWTTPEIYIVGIATHLSSEMLLLIFPFSFLHLIRRRNKKQFYAASIMFSIGFLGSLITIARTVYTSDEGRRVNYYVLSPLSSFEQAFGIFICCLPAFKTLITRRWSFGRLSGRGSSQSESYRSISGVHVVRGTTVGQDASGIRGNWDVEASKMTTLEARPPTNDPDLGIMRVDTFENNSPKDRVRSDDTR